MTRNVFLDEFKQQNRLSFAMILMLRDLLVTAAIVHSYLLSKPWLCIDILNVILTSSAHTLAAFDAAVQ